VRRGELYWAHLPDPIGRRPVLIVTRTEMLGVRASVTVAPITRTIRRIPSEVALDRSHGLRIPSVANCDSLQTIPKSTLGRRPMGRLAVRELLVLDRALCYALGIRSAN
jgi:mRNA interferase MazF